MWKSKELDYRKNKNKHTLLIKSNNKLIIL